MPNEAKIIVYYKKYCPFCDRAKSLLNSKGVKYEVKDIASSNLTLKEFAIDAKGARTVPQILINGNLIGGFDDLSALDKDGKLDALLK
ncbi:MAG: glutaredoxin 3 [Alphaproteobacteria bacterium]|nr:glutaredoxin 3 [Rickettsiales bacterium]